MKKRKGDDVLKNNATRDFRVSLIIMRREVIYKENTNGLYITTVRYTIEVFRKRKQITKHNKIFQVEVITNRRKAPVSSFKIASSMFCRTCFDVAASRCSSNPDCNA